MTDATGAAFVETREYRRFREFCDACRRYRYIGLCYGPPGVGKTLSARHYADWDRVIGVQARTPIAESSGPMRSPGNGCVFYTATVVNSPGQIEDDIARLRRQDARTASWQAIRSERRSRRSPRRSGSSRRSATSLFVEARLAHGRSSRALEAGRSRGFRGHPRTMPSGAEELDDPTDSARSSTRWTGSRCRAWSSSAPSSTAAGSAWC